MKMHRRNRGMCVCVSTTDLFISFHSSRLHTKRLLSQIFLSVSHFLPSSLPPLSAVSALFLYLSLSLSASPSDVYFSKFLKGKM